LIHHPSTVDCRGSLRGRRSRDDNACCVLASGDSQVLADQRPEQDPPGSLSAEPRPIPQQGGRNAGALAHNDGPPVGEGAHYTAHVLPRRSRPRGNRLEWRCGPASRLVAQLGEEPARSCRDRHRRADRPDQNRIGRGAGTPMGRDYRYLLWLRPVSDEDGAPDTRADPHTRPRARASIEQEAARIRERLDVDLRDGRWRLGSWWRTPRPPRRRTDADCSSRETVLSPAGQERARRDTGGRWRPQPES